MYQYSDPCQSHSPSFFVVYLVLILVGMRTILRSLVQTPVRTIPRISQLDIHSVYQAVIGSGFTWQFGGIAQLVELLI